MWLLRLHGKEKMKAKKRKQRKTRKHQSGGGGRGWLEVGGGVGGGKG
jgi:hypothetical protein